MQTSKKSEKETHGTYQTPMRRQETVASSKHGQERAIQLHHLQFSRSQRLSKNENHPALWVASFFTGPRCQSAMGLQWHERQRRLRSEHCERHPKKWTRNPKNTMRIAKHVLRWCPAKNAKKATCRCLLQSLVAHANKQELWKKTHGTYQTPMRRQETVASSKHGQERAIQLHHLQFSRSQRLSKNENHPALWVASFFTGPRCQSAMGLQWHERQRRLRSGRCERHPKKWTRNPKNTMRIAKHVLRWCPAKNAKKVTCRCLLQSLVAHENKQELWKRNTWHIPNSNAPPRNCCIVQAWPGEGHPTASLAVRQIPKAFQEWKSSGALSCHLLYWTTLPKRHGASMAWTSKETSQWTLRKTPEKVD